MSNTEIAKCLSSIFSGRGGTVRFIAGCLTLLGIGAAIAEYHYELDASTPSGSHLSFKPSTGSDPDFTLEPSSYTDGESTSEIPEQSGKNTI